MITIQIPTITFQPQDDILLTLDGGGKLRPLPIVATCGNYQGAGDTKFEAAKVAIDAWSCAEARRLASVVMSFNEDVIIG